MVKQCSSLITTGEKADIRLGDIENVPSPLFGINVPYVKRQAALWTHEFFRARQSFGGGGIVRETSANSPPKIIQNVLAASKSTSRLSLP